VTRRALERDGGEIDGGDPPAVLGQPYGIGALTASGVERPAGRQGGGLADQVPVRLAAPLLRQSRLNHLGKLAFAWLYWHVLLPGREIPAVPGEMPVAGKRLQPAHGAASPPENRKAR